jgi:23S rRNA pseudouridine955/2504/2580 synthase
MTQRSSKRLPKAQIGTVTADEDRLISNLLMFEDSDILVFNKPSGLAVQGGSGISVDIDRLLWAFANRKGRRPKLVHRLDRETSGVLIVAKTTPAAAHLSAQFEKRTIQKTYFALVSGCPTALSGVIDVPLMRIKSGGIDLVRPALPGEIGAMQATTDWRILACQMKCALIEARPHSGRMHQIRAHLCELGYPLAGDTKYGGLFSIGAVMIPRLLLHAARLEFIHPSTGENIQFEAPIAADFTMIISELELHVNKSPAAL